MVTWSVDARAAKLLVQTYMRKAHPRQMVRSDVRWVLEKFVAERAPVGLMTFTAAIKVLGEIKDHAGAHDAFLMMKQLGVAPDMKCFDAMLRATLSDPALFAEVGEMKRRAGFRVTAAELHAVLLMLYNRKRLRELDALWEAGRVESRDVTEMYNTAAGDGGAASEDGAAAAGPPRLPHVAIPDRDADLREKIHNAASLAARRAFDAGVPLDLQHYTFLIRCCATPAQADAWLARVKAAHMVAGAPQLLAAMEVAARCGDVARAQAYFDTTNDLIGEVAGLQQYTELARAHRVARAYRRAEGVWVAYDEFAGGGGGTGYTYSAGACVERLRNLVALQAAEGGCVVAGAQAVFARCQTHTAASYHAMLLVLRRAEHKGRGAELAAALDAQRRAQRVAGGATWEDLLTDVLALGDVGGDGATPVRSASGGRAGGPPLAGIVLSPSSTPLGGGGSSSSSSSAPRKRPHSPSQAPSSLRLKAQPERAQQHAARVQFLNAIDHAARTAEDASTEPAAADADGWSLASDWGGGEELSAAPRAAADGAWGAAHRVVRVPPPPAAPRGVVAMAGEPSSNEVGEEEATGAEEGSTALHRRRAPTGTDALYDALSESGLGGGAAGSDDADEAGSR